MKAKSGSLASEVLRLNFKESIKVSSQQKEKRKPLGRKGEFGRHDADKQLGDGADDGHNGER